ncbi:MAG: hypothetical protein HC898_04160, partial [Phycisphaerales bacterium]|nr:hypothetical protein [Phycisphaerales bacterium]
DHYRVQADRNLFVRRSGSRQSASNASTPANPTTSSPASQWLLTGTITLGPQQVAFFENSRSGETLRLTIGQTMPAGKLLKVETDQVTMEIEGQPQKVALGERLLPGTAASGSGDPASGVTDKPESEMSLLERLRARRQKELGR